MDARGGAKIGIGDFASKFSHSLARRKVRSALIGFLSPIQPPALQHLLDKNIPISHYIKQGNLEGIKTKAQEYRWVTKVVSAQDLAVWIRADLPQFYNTLASHPNGEKWFN